MYYQCISDFKFLKIVHNKLHMSKIIFFLICYINVL